VFDLPEMPVRENRGQTYDLTTKVRENMKIKIAIVGMANRDLST
jgi:hypothetical protein